ncbi:hypothetical protein MRB53_034656 [Persea americana]|uniref:Uncharacterized protein n=1 Tax=Persea americana TaxID=3435 RepID=A0ACC2K2M7_PERAE|nr:hypothetical protein MRB53_034656 [Persea americana]
MGRSRKSTTGKDFHCIQSEIHFLSRILTHRASTLAVSCLPSSHSNKRRNGDAYKVEHCNIDGQKTVAWSLVYIMISAY